MTTSMETVDTDQLRGIHLFHRLGCPRCELALLALLEKDLGFTEHAVPQLRVAAAKSGCLEYPVLVVDGRSTSGAMAILTGLARSRTGRDLLPDGAADLEAVEAWVDQHESLRTLLECLGRETTEMPATEAARRLAAVLGELDRWLDHRAWIGGRRLTVADLVWATSLARLGPLGTRHPNIARWLEQVRGRPAFRRAIEDNMPLGVRVSRGIWARLLRHLPRLRSSRSATALLSTGRQV